MNTAAFDTADKFNTRKKGRDKHKGYLRYIIKTQTNQIKEKRPTKKKEKRDWEGRINAPQWTKKPSLLYHT